MTNTENTTEYIITSCPDHGVKVTGDLVSLRVYAEAAATDTLMARGGFTGTAPSVAQRAHEALHADGSDCWSCCPNMTIDPHGLVYC